MKRVFSFVIAIAMILNIAVIPVLAEGSGIAATAAYVNTAPVIDGVIDDIWNTTERIYTEENSIDGNEARGYVQILWDENNLYFLTVVTDSTPIDANDTSCTNGVNFWVSEKNTDSDGYVALGDYLYMVSSNGVDALEADKLYIDNSKPYEVATKAVELTDSGYIVEVKIPSCQNLTYSDGHVIGFTASIDDDFDADGERDEYTFTARAVECGGAADNFWSATNALAKVKLVSPVVEEPEDEISQLDPSPMYTEIKKIDVSEDMDCVKRSAYDGVEPIIISEQNLHSWSDSPQNTSGKVWTAWDGEYIYIYAECYDPTPYYDGEVWQNDNISVFLDFDNNKTPEYKYDYESNGDHVSYITLCPDAARSDYHCAAYNFAETCTYHDVENNMYYYEFKIAVPFDVQVDDLANIGFEVTFTNATAEDGRVGVISWSPFGADIWKWTHSAGTAKLMPLEEVVEPEVPVVPEEPAIVVPDGPNLGTIPFAGPVTADAIKDASYEDGLNLKVDNLIRGNDNGTSANMWLTYGDDSLNVFVEVKDSSIVVRENSMPWDSDNLELFIDYSGCAYSDSLNGADSDHLDQAIQFRISAGGYPSVYGFDNFIDSWSAYGDDEASVYFDYAARQTDTGYVLEYVIPLSNTNLSWGEYDLDEGDQFSIYAQLTDFTEGSSDTSGYCLVTGPNWAWDAHLWGEVTLDELAMGDDSITENDPSPMYTEIKKIDVYEDVDAVKRSAYDSVEPIIINQQNLHAWSDSPQDTSANVWTSWDGEYVYIYAECYDASPYYQGEVWQNDNINVFLDFDNNKNPEYKYDYEGNGDHVSYITLCPNGDRVEYHCAAYNFVETCVYHDVENNMYYYELKVAVPFDVQISDLMEIGFEVTFTNATAEDGRVGVISWSPFGADIWKWTHSAGTAKLMPLEEVVEPEVPVVPEGPIVPDGPDLGKVPYAESVVADAVKDSSYENGLYLSVDSLDSYGVDTGAFADLWVTYSDDSINVFAEITDNNIIVRENANPWDNDNLELFIDFSSCAYSDILDGADRDHLDQAIQFRIDASGYPSVYGFDKDGDSWNAYGEEANSYFEYAARKTDSGYALEYIIPLGNKTVDWGEYSLKDGDQISIYAQLTDHTSSDTTRYTLLSGISWAWDAHNWGEVVFDHNIEYFAEKPANAVATGLKEHYKCSVCGKMYLDKDATVEVITSDLILPIVIDIEDETYVAVTEETVKVTETFIEEAIEQAISSTDSEEKKVVIDTVNMVDSNGDSIAKESVTIPAAAVEKVTDNSQSLEVATATATVSFDTTALGSITEAAKESTSGDASASNEITIDIKVVDQTQLDQEPSDPDSSNPEEPAPTVNAAQKETISKETEAENKELAAVVSADIFCDGEEISGSFNGGVAKITIPYKSSVDEVVEDVSVIFIDDEGNSTPVEDVTFDDSLVTFTVEHFSEYAVIKTVPVIDDGGNDGNDDDDDDVIVTPEDDGFDYESWYLAMKLQSVFNQSFTVAVGASEGGAVVSNLGTDTVKYGTSITYSIVPAAGYEIEAVYINGNNIGAVSSYTFNYLTSNVSISASFRKLGSSSGIVIPPVTPDVDTPVEPEVPMTSDIVLGAIVKNAPAGTVLNYTVTLSDSSITGIYGDVAFINGVAKISIKSGSEVKATGLPIDITYEVTCEAPENCLITSINESGVTYGAESHVVFVCVFYEAEVEIENPVTSDDK